MEFITEKYSSDIHQIWWGRGPITGRNLFLAEMTMNIVTVFWNRMPHSKVDCY
jgi:hypothetical protein